MTRAFTGRMWRWISWFSEELALCFRFMFNFPRSPKTFQINLSLNLLHSKKKCLDSKWLVVEPTSTCTFVSLLQRKPSWLSVMLLQGLSHHTLKKVIRPTGGSHVKGCYNFKLIITLPSVSYNENYFKIWNQNINGDVVSIILHVLVHAIGHFAVGYDTGTQDSSG